MNTAPAHGSVGRLALIFFAAVLLLALPQAALLPLLDRDEPRFAEASREMIQSGNYIIPTFNGVPRYAKPPLIYWCQAVCFRVFGENAFAARLPSLLATAGTAALLVTWGAALGSLEIGAIAALSYAFCFQTIQQGRVATADALLVFFMTLTVYAGWQLIRLAVPESSNAAWRFWGIVLTLALAGALLAKGPEAFLAVIPLLWCLRKRSLRLFFALRAMVMLAILLFACWGVPALVQSHGDYFRVGIGEDVVHRSVSGMQGHGASTVGWYLLLLPFYFVWFWLSALPWSPLLIMRRRQLFGGWKPDATDNYLLINIALVFIVFTVMVTKLPHYTLPAFPLLALLFARRWVTTQCVPACRPAQLGWACAFFYLVVALLFVPIAILGGMDSPVGKLVAQSGSKITPDTKVALVGFEEPNAIWETRRIVHGYPVSIRAEQISAFLREPGSRAVITDKLVEAWNLPENAVMFPANGFNAARLRNVNLNIYLKPEPPQP